MNRCRFRPLLGVLALSERKQPQQSCNGTGWRDECSVSSRSKRKKPQTTGNGTGWRNVGLVLRERKLSQPKFEPALPIPFLMLITFPQPCMFSLYRFFSLSLSLYIYIYNTGQQFFNFLMLSRFLQLIWGLFALLNQEMASASLHQVGFWTKLIWKKSYLVTKSITFLWHYQLILSTHIILNIFLREKKMFCQQHILITW